MDQMSKPMIDPVTQFDFRNGMASLAAAVHVVTTVGPDGRSGFTASAVCSVTDTPPTLLVCVNQQTSSLGAILDSGRLCINTLTPHHEALSRQFGAKIPMDERFAGGSWSSGIHGAPVLEDALVSFECSLQSVQEIGTHTVLFCNVLKVNPGEASEALVYFGRAYRAVSVGG